MSLKPQPPRPMPPEMAAWGAKHLAADDPYKLIGDLLYEDYHDEDFADLYHNCSFAKLNCTGSCSTIVYAIGAT